jgi:2-oxoglutarate ferredoxin oxidoreductase subunit delta
LSGREHPSRDELSIVSKTKARVTLIVNEEFCKGCGLCASACPRDAIGMAEHINSRGFHPAVLLHPENCTACAACALMCPDACIKIVKSG